MARIVLSRLCVAPLIMIACATDAGIGAAEDGPRLKLETRRDVRSGEDVRIGAYTVYEDRQSQTGRTIDLDIIILPATGPNPKPDPVFWLAGGPGVNVTSYYPGIGDSWIRRDRDIVLVDQRGTGGNHRLACTFSEDPDDLQRHLDPVWSEDRFRVCMESLAEEYDLTKYSTPIAMDDLNEVRQALGYERINLIGGSYGTRAGLVYMRRHPETVRSAILRGVAPIAFTNPLYHAGGGQAALDLIFARCKADPQLSAAYPQLRRRFEAILDRLEESPARVAITHPETGKPTTVTLSRAAFAGSLRIMMYGDNTRVPLLLSRAFEGDFSPFVEGSIQSNRSLDDMIAFGMLLCVTCAEDLDRIDPEIIERETAGTFLGDRRVRAQLALCEFWPRSDLPENYGDPVSVDTPVLLISGFYDPVTPPRWGAEAASHLPNSLHVVVPGTHSFGGPCVDELIHQFLETADVAKLDLSCVEDMRPAPFVLPED